MGSKTFEGVWFIVYSHDHSPPHVHGKLGGIQVIIDLLPNNKIVQSRRRAAVTPANAKRSDVRRILTVAAAHTQELWDLWEKTHGTAS